MLASLLLACTIAADWQSLFDGKSFQGWQLRPKDTPPLWAIEDGAIRTIPRSERTGRASDILTEERYLNFDLRFEFRVAARGNSGIKYRLQGVRRPRPDVERPGPADYFFSDDYESAPTFHAIGFEYQICDDAIARDGLHSAASLYDFLAPKKPRPVEPGAWHEGRIVVKGTRFEHWLDGRKVLAGDFSSKSFQQIAAERAAAPRSNENQRIERRMNAEAFAANPLRESPIALTHHNSDVRFRNIRIKRLK